MRPKHLLVVMACAAAAGWLVASSLFIVSETDQALLVRLGKPVRTETQPGLNFKIPLIDTVVLYDKRLLPLEPGVDQIILGDQKRIEVETFSLFRINDPLRFFQSVGTLEQARSQLSQIVSTTVRKQLGQVALPALLTAERDEITARLRNEVAREARPIGVDVVDVRIRRADLRVREAKEVRAQGFEAGQSIRARADGERTVLLSEASRDAQKMRGEGDAEASRVAAAAYGKDPDFFDLYRTLQLYRGAFAQGSQTVVLSPSSTLMKYFDIGPASTPAVP